MTRADFGTKSTIETRRTSLVAIYASCPGPTFLDRENASILKELTILHLQKKKENRWLSENIKRNFIYQHRNCQRLDNVDSTLKDFYNHNISKINFTNGNYFLLRRHFNSQMQYIYIHVNLPFRWIWTYSDLFWFKESIQ